MSVPFVPKPGISGIFGRMESAHVTWLNIRDSRLLPRNKEGGKKRDPGNEKVTSKRWQGGGKNGERATGNGQRETGNGERWMGNWKWKTENQEPVGRTRKRATGNREQESGKECINNPPDNSKWRTKEKNSEQVLQL